MLSDEGLCREYHHYAAVQFVKNLPGGIAGAFSYGSAVFSQAVASASGMAKRGTQKPMVDIIIIVHDAVKWHEEVSHPLRETRSTDGNVN